MHRTVALPIASLLEVFVREEHTAVVVVIVVTAVVVVVAAAVVAILEAMRFDLRLELRAASSDNLSLGDIIQVIFGIVDDRDELVMGLYRYPLR